MSANDPTETRWTLIARAASEEVPDPGALNEWMVHYLPVLHGFVRRLPVLDEGAGEDLVQSFVQKRILEKQLLQKADASKGRFRTFLFRSFQNHIRDELRRQRASRRSPGDGNLMSFEEVESGVGRHSEMERTFHVAWIRHLLDDACGRMEKQCRSTGRLDCWFVFEARLQAPMLEGAEPVSYAEVVKHLGLASPTQASNLLITAKRMLRKHLEDVIRETVEDPDDLSEEWTFLKQVLE